MKCVILADNRTLLPELETEHGLSVYLETKHCKWLLDVGATDLFMRNAQKMNINIADVDYVFISHGHADHIGGLPAFLELNTKAKVLLSSQVLNQQYYSVRVDKKDISLKADLKKYWDRLLFVDGEMQLEDEVRIYSCHKDEFAAPQANRTLLKNTEKGLVKDDFNHELVFSAGSTNRLLFTGCAHKGLLNILSADQQLFDAPVRWLIGGFHLLDGTYEKADEIEKISEFLASKYRSTHFYTGHCTGNTTFDLLKQKLENNIDQFYTGLALELEE